MDSNGLGWSWCSSGVPKGAASFGLAGVVDVEFLGSRGVLCWFGRVWIVIGINATPMERVSNSLVSFCLVRFIVVAGPKPRRVSWQARSRAGDLGVWCGGWARHILGKLCLPVFKIAHVAFFP